jgi:membrane protein implicated in regulation of membrane protease activity
MRKNISFTILGLTLLAVATSPSNGQTPIVYVIGFLVGLALYLIAVAFLFAVAASAASPLLAAVALWLYRRHRQGKPLPRWIKSLRLRVARRLPVLARITASGRAAKNAWRQSVSGEPAAAGDRAGRAPDAQEVPAGTAPA